MTTYNAAIPQATDLISNSQSQLLGNFDQLNTQFAIDHTAFNTGSGNGNGFHKKITFGSVLATPSPAGAVSVLYTKTVAGAEQLFYKNSEASEQQVTNGAVPSGSNRSSGSLTLPNGFILKWGYIAPSITDNSPISFPVAFPTACFTVVGTGLLAGASSRVFWIVPSSINASGFTPRTDSNSMGVSYWAIGY